MYLTSFTARRIKCFEEVTLHFPPSAEGSRAGWYVILGANATGKTTLLQAIAVALVGASPAMRLVSPASWVRRDSTYGILEVEFLKGEDDKAEGASRSGPYQAKLAVLGEDPVELQGVEYTAPQVTLLGNPKDKAYRGLQKGPYAANKSGWLVCGYGAFRRLTGGAENDLTYEPGRVGRVASLFHESVALKRDLDWLPRLYARSLEHSSDAAAMGKEFHVVRTLLNQLLPTSVQIADVDTQRVYFTAPGASRVDLLDLSDGYRSFLALVMDLLRQIAEAFGSVADRVKVKADGDELEVLAEGVVLIDEIDLHLHPTWQREIGPRLRRVFPQLQFVVTSHSPFIAQAATDGGLFVVRAASRDAPVQVIQPPSQVSGWTVEQILLSPLFGLTDTRDPETEALLHAHAILRGKAKFDHLDAEEQQELVSLERALAERLMAPGELARQELDEAAKVAAEKVRRMLLDAASRTTTPR